MTTPTNRQDNKAAPKFPFADGTARISDKTITAALLAMGGAAWDGRSPLIYPPHPGGPDYPGWLRLLEQPEIRTIRIEYVDKSKAEELVTIRNPEGYTDSKGTHYAKGEQAPMDRIRFHLRAWYQWRTGGAITREVPWGYEDFLFWFTQFHRAGGLLRICNEQTYWLGKLRDVIRESGAGDSVPGPTGQEGDICSK